ncbi:MAG: hypothetical protein ABJB16_02990, partial [Saprospiraceae bacterium]
MRYITFCLMLTLCIFKSSGQSISISNDGAPANPSSMLDVRSTSKGLLTPRMTLSQRNMIASPATGLMIYQTDNTPGFYHFNGTIWTLVSSVNNWSMT